MFRQKPRNPAQRLRIAVDAMPQRTREAMLRGMSDNTIVAGAYTDPRSGGICPMLAAHRNGGRTSLASFARSWDRFTGARRPRLATRRELRTLTGYLEMSILRNEQDEESVAALAARIRADRELAAKREAELQQGGAAEAGQEVDAPNPKPNPRAEPKRDTGERHRGRELRRRSRWSWLIPARRYDVFSERLAAAEEQIAEQKADELLGSPDREPA